MAKVKSDQWAFLSVLVKIILCNYFKQTISMNNKFWNAPAWSMANRYAGTTTNN